VESEKLRKLIPSGGRMHQRGFAVVIFSVAMLAAMCAGVLRAQSTSTNKGQVVESQDQKTRAVIDEFNSALNAHDSDRLSALLTDDTVFENTSPAPDGQRIEGKAAVVEFWRGWMSHNPDARFEAEEIIVSGNRATVRWVYRKIRDGQPWHLRGIDLFTVRDGRVATKLAYVKG
jgi:ketosteroid isomerase-like protein